jgi:creatinine amidohydrolase
MRLLLLCLMAVCAPAAAQSSVFIEDLTWTEVRDAIKGGATTALYYAGSTEQNGPHLVLGKHNAVARHVAQRIALRLGNALVYPVMPFAPTGDAGARTGHMAFPGSVNISSGTFGAVARDVALSAIAAGFRHVALMGDHGGGQDALRQVAEILDREWRGRGARVHYIGDVYFASGKQAAEIFSRLKLKGADGHGGLSDTAELLHVDIEGRMVRRQLIAAPDARMGVEGDPRAATTDIGRALIDLKVENAVAQIRRAIGP